MHTITRTITSTTAMVPASVTGAVRAIALSVLCLSASAVWPLHANAQVQPQPQDPPTAAAAAQAPAPTAAQATPQAAPAQRPPAAQDEYVPIDEIPEHDKLPAAPFLIGAYTFVWLALLGYVWSIWQRLSRVEAELKRVASGASR